MERRRGRTVNDIKTVLLRAVVLTAFPGISACQQTNQLPVCRIAGPSCRRVCRPAVGKVARSGGRPQQLLGWALSGSDHGWDAGGFPEPCSKQPAGSARSVGRERGPAQLRSGGRCRKGDPKGSTDKDGHSLVKSVGGASGGDVVCTVPLRRRCIDERILESKTKMGMNTQRTAR